MFGEGGEEVVRALVEAGCDVIVRRDADNDTPLYLADSYGGRGDRKLRAKYTQYWVGLDTALAFCM